MHSNSYIKQAVKYTLRSKIVKSDPPIVLKDKAKENNNTMPDNTTFNLDSNTSLMTFLDEVKNEID